MSELIHFAHGNGFPSPCYRQFLHYLQPRFEYCFIDRVGHSPDFPVTENWHYLVDEVIHSVTSQCSQPVIVIGHSLGGVLSFRAAIENPALFKAVILLDSPIIGRIKSNLLRVSKAIGMIDHLTPAFRTRGRQYFWPTREQALSYLKGRKLFKNFTKACLEDYIDYGMIKTDEGYTLRFDKDIEYQIYRTIPHILYEYEGKLKTPAAVIYGDKSNVVDILDVRYMKKYYNIQSHKIPGTHMFPMEHPKLAADLVIKAIDELLNK